MKKVLSVLLAVLLVLSMAPVSLAATTEANNAANHLYELGLFAGTGAQPDGSPIFSLDNMPDRSQGITMLVALLGKSEEAKSGTWYTPFTDVPAWAKPAVGYAYTNKLTAGASPTKFGHGQPLTASQYLTFVLTALGYEQGTGKDFTWRNPFALSDKLGITGGRYTASSRFTRGDVAIVSNNALNAKMKNSTKTLLDALIESGAVEDPNPSPDPGPGTPTPAPGDSKDKQLVQYIIANGKTDEAGEKYITSTQEISGNTMYTDISYEPEEEALWFFGMFESSENYTTCVILEYSLADHAFDSFNFFSYKDDKGLELEMGATLNPATYTKNTVLNFQKLSGPDNISLSEANKLANYTTLLSVASWGVQLEKIGFQLSDIGFTSFTASLQDS